MVRWARRLRRTVGYWPQVAIVAGVALNLVGTGTGETLMFATGSNLVIVGGLFLRQRHRNGWRDVD